ncbi:hypothetical protein M409DRAFT_22734 [Zasmidium cellare ATCC 36951]|uniref:Uncharacterized protein n=1 Tax=Zasmidium cellare ATCC 36951 TaxID=1080233 RepID=A0A6A6CJA0_ZASCE|nr:uncharacterized protein M409DRAFT_22734 [Zasmidium cellare ATCC 36951]KAF2167307.1 hypothetical protein M409DRAFT_22734 [Zasmidium cellare ATCC 36951]
MMRNFSSSATPPVDLRRRHQARRDCSFHWDSDVPDNSFNSGLDLSVHHTSSPFTTPPPAVTREREFHVSSARRRPRNSRGTKEAKKRRDARRNRRKLAAQYLDEQLSRDIDDTLNKANIRPPQPATLPAPTPVLPTNYFWPPQPQQSSSPTRRSPSPFQLPPLDFNTFDIHDFPLLASPKQSPPLSPQPFFTGVPNWCPRIPSLTSKPRWSSGWPKFFDLSHLPERKSSPPETKCQELQLWQGDAHLNQRKQSRFFPPQPSSKPTVKLPSTGCTLHRSKGEDHALADETVLTEETNMSRPRSISDAVRKIVAAVMADPTNSLDQEPTAVNLWNILSDEIEKKRYTHAGDRESSLEDDSNFPGGVPIYAESSEAPLPAELDGKEIPYTHENSLTGFANEVAELHAGNHQQDLVLSDSAIYLAEAISHIDDEAADCELAAMPWPLTPALPIPEILYPFLSTEERIEADTNTDSDDITGSIAHYTSEQRLFDVEPSTPHSTAESTCDLETFLSMGHVENCWCRDCEEEPELVNDEWATPLTESDGWMMWSATEEEAEDAIELIVPMDDNGSDEYGSFQTWTTGCDWDDFYPSMTSQSPAPELDDEFLGYYDDGPAFSHDGEKHWMWGC